MALNEDRRYHAKMCGRAQRIDCLQDYLGFSWVISEAWWYLWV